jgi:hypothetical protein
MSSVDALAAGPALKHAPASLPARSTQPPRRRPTRPARATPSRPPWRRPRRWPTACRSPPRPPPRPATTPSERWPGRLACAGCRGVQASARRAVADPPPPAGWPRPQVLRPGGQPVLRHHRRQLRGLHRVRGRQPSLALLSGPAGCAGPPCPTSHSRPTSLLPPAPCPLPAPAAASASTRCSRGPTRASSPSAACRRSCASADR